MKIAVLGTGVYGLAIANALAIKNNEIRMWSHSLEIVNEYKEFKMIK